MHVLVFSPSLVLSECYSLHPFLSPSPTPTFDSSQLQVGLKPATGELGASQPAFKAVIGCPAPQATGLAGARSGVAQAIGASSQIACGLAAS